MPLPQLPPPSGPGGGPPMGGPPMGGPGQGPSLDDLLRVLSKLPDSAKQIIVQELQKQISGSPSPMGPPGMPGGGAPGGGLAGAAKARAGL
jgi:hypothetical protein